MNKNIKILMYTQMLTVIGSFMLNFSLVYWIYVQYSDAYILSIYNLMFIIPLIIVSPFSGYLIDIISAKKMLYISEFGEIVASILLLTMFLFAATNIYVIFVAAIIISITESFRFPSYSVLVSHFVNKSQYRIVHGYYMLSISIPGIVGPLFAPHFIKLFGFEGVILFNIITLLFSILLIRKINYEEKTKKLNFVMKLSVFKEIKRTFFGVFLKKKVLLMLSVSAICIFIFNMLRVLVPVFFISLNNQKPYLYSNAEFIMGTATFLGALIVTLNKKNPDSFFVSFLKSVFCMSMLVLLLGVSSSYIFWYVLLFLYIVLNQFADSNAQANWQTIIDIEHQGFVFGMKKTVIWFFGAMGTATAGKVMDIMKNYDYTVTQNINIILRNSGFVSLIVLTFIYVIYIRLFRKDGDI